MSVLAFIAMEMDIIDQTLFTTVITLNSVVVILCIGLFIYDLRRYYRERLQGKQSVWYKRPTILISEALFLISLANMMNELKVGNFIPAEPLFYIFVFALPTIGIMLLGYSLLLNARKRRS